MTRVVTVGTLQLVAVRGDKDANLAALEDLGGEAARAGASVVVAPEMAVSGYCWPDDEEVRALAEPLDGPTVRRLVRLAKATGAWFVVGMPELDLRYATLHNTCVLVGPDGLEGSYRKVHPFIADPYWAVDGNRLPPVWKTPAGRVTPLICADLDYPEPTRYAALAGADWVAFPAAWVDEPAPSATWRLRAWENALPVVASDMAGHELGVQFSGGSSILDHEGNVLAALDDRQGYVVADLDLDRGRTARRRLLARRRPAEYRPLALSKRWPRRTTEELFGSPATADRVVTSVLTAPPGELPAVPAGTGLAVLPAFHLCGGRPGDERSARDAAVSWNEALHHLQAFAAGHGCEVVTSLVEQGRDGDLHHTLVAVDAAGDAVTRRATDLGPDMTWAAPGLEPWVNHVRPWGRLALLTGDELELFEPSRVCAIRDADVIAVPAALSWQFPVHFAGTRVPLGPELQAPDTCFAHPVRLRAGDSHVWIAFANAGTGAAGEAGTPGGVFSPDHVRMPRTEAIAQGTGWATLSCATRPPDELGSICENKPQLLRRRTDLFAEPLLDSSEVEDDALR